MYPTAAPAPVIRGLARVRDTGMGAEFAGRTRRATLVFDPETRGFFLMTGTQAGSAALDGSAAPSATPGGMSLPSMIGFSLGMIGDRIFRDAPALLLLIFMTDYLAVPPALAGAAVFVPKLLIMFVDPLVGTLSDRLHTRWGGRVPLMFVGALIASASVVAFFHVPHFAGPLAQAVYMSFIVFAGFSGYSLYTVPYLTMSAEIAHGAEERRRIMSWRVIFMAIGLTCSAFAGEVVQSLGGGLHGYGTMGWIYAGVCLLTMMATVIAASRAPAEQSFAAAPSLLVQFRMVAGNATYLRLLLVCFAQKLGEGVGYGSFAYFCIYVVKQPLSSIGYVVLASMAGQILTQPAWLWASRRWSPATLYAVGVIGWCVNLLLWLAMAGQSSLWLIPLGLEAGAAAGGFQMVTLSMLSNILAADTARTGVNREGVYSGVWCATEKLAFAGGALVVGVMLSLFGFVESTSGAQATQSSMAVTGIALTYCGVNMVIYLASIVAIMRSARSAPAEAVGVV
jgi:GPH family glycoside/pentoside/hexuronide:cation symporter